MEFLLRIKCDNAAFHEHGSEESADGQEVSRILCKVAFIVEQMSLTDDDGARCFDVNGNNVGAWEVKGARP